MAFSSLIDGDNYLTQPFSCTDYAGEWVVPTSWCASGHFHTGIDIGCACGLNVRTPRAGTVVQVGIIYLGDSAVVLKVDAEDVWLEFGHLNAAAVSVGQHVNAGDVVGWIGTKGNSTGCHLHLEARTDGPFQGINNVLDPAPYLQLPVAPPAPVVPDPPTALLLDTPDDGVWLLDRERYVHVDTPAVEASLFGTGILSIPIDDGMHRALLTGSWGTFALSLTGALVLEAAT